MVVSTAIRQQGCHHGYSLYSVLGQMGSYAALLTLNFEVWNKCLQDMNM